MNRLPTKKRSQILAALVEGNSLRATSRMVGVSINTVTKLLVDVGTACAEYQDTALRDLRCQRIQADEIWAFCYAKQKNVPADRFQLTTDGASIYQNTYVDAFGPIVDYAQLQKLYAATVDQTGRYSPAACIGTKTAVITGTPNPDHISTSYVERANLTMRMSMRRFTRLTNGFSKKAENHAHAVAIHFMYYNFGRYHQTLRSTPAMRAGVTDHRWSLEEIVALAN